MPQKFWEVGRRTKHLGAEDLAAMSLLEIAEWLKDEYNVTDIKPTDIDITDFHEPPITTKGDPYLRNVVDNWTVQKALGQKDGFATDSSLVIEGSVMMVLTRQEMERQYRKIADADQVASF